MTGPSRSSFVAGIVVLLACLICLSPISAASAAHKKGSVQVTTVSVQSFEKDLAAGQVAAASFRAKQHLLRLRLLNQHRVAVHYGTSQEKARLRAMLKAHGVKLATVKPPSHKLRYIVGGAAVVLVLAVVAGLVIWRRRRRAEFDES